MKEPSNKIPRPPLTSKQIQLREDARIRATRHGMSRTPEYHSWNSMRGRCKTPSDDAFYRYGGRGITVCERWEKFENFYADMGRRPPGLTLDRIDTNAGYSKENCRWATKKEQGENRDNCRWYTWRGLTMQLPEWAKQLGFERDVLYMRIQGGWSLERAFTEPVGFRFQLAGLPKSSNERVAHRVACAAYASL